MLPRPTNAQLRPGVAAGPITTALVAGLPAEGYRIELAETGIRIEAADDAGLFYAAQTLEQLGEHPPLGSIEDHPRFAYRGAMLDVARHFFSVADVTRYIDDIARLKLNHLHLHLTDDQGWRIAIDAYPRLTEVGGATQVGGGGGGWYSKEDYRAIVEHAASRFVTIVPEVDMPGHTNAAIVAYPELGDEPATAYEGIEVGFSSLAIGRPTTYVFVETVLRELAAMTPGPYLHLGGDESLATTDEDFLAFIARATALGATTGKRLIGWHEMGRSRELPPGTIGQYWDYRVPREHAAEHTRSFVEQGGRVIMSPADVAYLDIKPTADSPLGLTWADGPTSVRDAYEWDPADIVPGVGDEQLLGVEAPLWTETITSIDEIEEMAFPRLAAIAEIAWSPRGERDFVEFADRLAVLERQWDALGIRFHRAAEVSWLD
ncbi:family 20 glycosylhydrolase [Leifsonia sp. H3M29-4]|uniref:family 20 glycosylhydrolase n=1 Tax=Salinibacterium metalliresistens TaxID=3031321 RepID=UPI0023DCE9E4|nr:family 20 glycosylhydrolase [Salinibacterium metalliresistens]MDF1478274.1 family 20 glycosylhydrolase [Salinibacterium metalliresistens]